MYCTWQANALWKTCFLSSCQQLKTWWNCFINLGIAFVPSTEFLPVTQLRYIDISSINDNMSNKVCFRWKHKLMLPDLTGMWLINQYNLSLCCVCEIILWTLSFCAIEYPFYATYPVQKFKEIILQFSKNTWNWLKVT